MYQLWHDNYLMCSLQSPSSQGCKRVALGNELYVPVGISQYRLGIFICFTCNGYTNVVGPVGQGLTLLEQVFLCFSGEHCPLLVA